MARQNVNAEELDAPRCRVDRVAAHHQHSIGFSCHQPGQNSVHKRSRVAKEHELTGTTMSRNHHVVTPRDDQLPLNAQCPNPPRR